MIFLAIFLRKPNHSNSQPVKLDDSRVLMLLLKFQFPLREGGILVYKITAASPRELDRLV